MKPVVLLGLIVVVFLLRGRCCCRGIVQHGALNMNTNVLIFVVRIDGTDGFSLMMGGGVMMGTARRIVRDDPRPLTRGEGLMNVVTIVRLDSRRWYMQCQLKGSIGIRILIVVVIVIMIVVATARWGFQGPNMCLYQLSHTLDDTLLLLYDLLHVVGGSGMW